MATLLTTMTPIFGLMAMGYLAVYARVIDADGVRGLVLFVFNFAIPALLFRSLAVMEMPPDIEWGFLVAFYAGSLVTYALGMFVGGVVFGRTLREQAVFGMCASYSNLVMMGIPIVLMALGPEASLPMLLIIGFHAATFMPLTLVLINSGSTGQRGLGASIASALRETSANPIILGIALGFVARLTGVPLWVGFDGLFELLGGAAVPAALFAMGGSLAGLPMAGSEGPASVLAVVKLGLHPLLVWIVAGPILHLDGLWASVPVVLAAMPSAVNAYLFGARYEAATEVAAKSVLLTSVCSMVTIAVVLALVGG